MKQGETQATVRECDMQPIAISLHQDFVGRFLDAREARHRGWEVTLWQLLCARHPGSGRTTFARCERAGRTARIHRPILGKAVRTVPSYDHHGRLQTIALFEIHHVVRTCTSAFGRLYCLIVCRSMFLTSRPIDGVKNHVFSMFRSAITSRKGSICCRCRTG